MKLPVEVDGNRELPQLQLEKFVDSFDPAPLGFVLAGEVNEVQHRFRLALRQISDGFRDQHGAGVEEGIVDHRAQGQLAALGKTMRERAVRE